MRGVNEQQGHLVAMLSAQTLAPCMGAKMLLPPFLSTSTLEWLHDFQKPVVQSLLPLSVVQMALFLPPVPCSFCTTPTIRRQERKSFCLRDLTKSNGNW